MEDISGIENVETLKPLLVYHFDPLPPTPGWGTGNEKFGYACFV